MTRLPHHSRPHHSRPHYSRLRRDERGTGLLGTVLGVAIVAGLLGFAANLTLGLWTRSTVDAVAYDAARDLATAPRATDPDTAARTAITRARSMLGPYGDRVDFDVTINDEAVALRVRAPGVGLLPAMVDTGPMVGALDRTIVVRREAP
jgi:hypothetical protein